MTIAEVVAAVSAIVAAVKEVPELVSAVEGVFNALSMKQDPSHALKHLEAVAAAQALGIDPSGL